VRRKKILELIRLMEENELAELEIGNWFRRVRIGRVSRGGFTVSPAGEAGSALLGEDIPEAVLPATNLVEVKAPLVGTFYRSPSPGAPMYIEVGDTVKKGQVLCIVEAMKVMNEIEAEQAGTVREILVGDSESVEFGQVLFRIEP
jgi:acetyl-CoA carboxylase biotin carboxyl carrier protein